MREVPSTHCDSRNFPGLKPRGREGVEVSDLINTKAMFDEVEKTGPKRLKESLTTAVDELSRDLPPYTDEVSPMVECDGDGRERRQRTLLLVKMQVEKGHTVDSQQCRNKDGVKAVARKRKDVWKDEHFCRCIDGC